MISTSHIRALNALKARRAGIPLKQIAAEYGVTKERARQLSKQGLKIEYEQEHSDDIIYELSVRIRNALTIDRCELTPRGVVEHYKTMYVLKRVPALGKKSIGELMDWLVRHGEKPLPCK